MKKQTGFAMLHLVVFALVLIGGGGWIANIVKIVGIGFESFDGLLIARCIGVFVAPLGAVLGFV